jgi:sigma-B regulation protein RsbU (phosphoserine phosphatase)
MTWVRAGHPSPIIIRDGKHISLSEGDPPIGVFADCTYTEHVTQLQSMDRLILFSDGISECQEPKSFEMLGSDRFAALLESHSQTPFGEIISKIDSALLAYRTQETFDDDVSLLAIEVK